MNVQLKSQSFARELGALSWPELGKSGVQVEQYVSVLESLATTFNWLLPIVHGKF